MEKISISHFRKMLSPTVRELENQCKKWEKLCSQNDLSEEVLGDIRTTIGLTKLLLNQKLKQFKGLIDDSEFKRSEKEITCLDLQGFWDMVYNEVEKIQKNFQVLEERKKNNWELIEEKPDQPKVKKISAHPISAKQAASAQSLAVAARARIAEARRNMQQKIRQKENELAVDILQPSNNLAHTAEGEQDQVGSVGISTKIASKSSAPNVTETKSKTKKPSNMLKKSGKTQDNSNLLKEKVSNKMEPGKTEGKNIVPAVSSDKENMMSAKRSKLNSNLISTEQKSSVPSNTKNRKDYGKLQCVTRSAARAMAQQN